MTDSFATCSTCHKIIKLLKGSSYWTLLSKIIPSRCKTHDPLVTTFDSSWDAMRVNKEALKWYWILDGQDEECGEITDHYVQWENAIKYALKELNYKCQVE